MKTRTRSGMYDACALLSQALQRLQHIPRGPFHLALPAGDTQLPPQPWAQRPARNAPVQFGGLAFLRQQRRAVPGPDQAFDRIVVVQLDPRLGVQPAAANHSPVTRDSWVLLSLRINARCASQAGVTFVGGCQSAGT